MGKSFSYEILKGVRLAWFDCWGPPCPFLVYLRWPTVLKFRVESFLASWLVTRICWVAVRTSSSSIEYLFSHLNKSSIVTRGFLARNTKKDVPGQILLLKILQDNIHAVRFYLEHGLPKPFHEFPYWLIFLHFYVLQDTDVLVMPCWAQVLSHKGLWQIPEIIHGVCQEVVEPWKSLTLKAGKKDFAQ